MNFVFKIFGSLGMFAIVSGCTETKSASQNVKPRVTQETLEETSERQMTNLDANIIEKNASYSIRVRICVYQPQISCEIILDRPAEAFLFRTIRNPAEPISYIQEVLEIEEYGLTFEFTGILYNSNDVPEGVLMASSSLSNQSDGYRQLQPPSSGARALINFLQGSNISQGSMSIIKNGFVYGLGDNPTSPLAPRLVVEYKIENLGN